jgi:hypothetical protein
MESKLATSILKLSAILIMFIGFILVTNVFLQRKTVSEMQQLYPGGVYPPGKFPGLFKLTKRSIDGYKSASTVLFWGFILYLTSPLLGRRIAREKDLAPKKIDTPFEDTTSKT